MADETEWKDVAGSTSNEPAKWSLIVAGLLLFPISIVSMFIPVVGIGTALVGVGLGLYTAGGEAFAAPRVGKSEQ